MDPLYSNIELLPTDKTLMLRQQHKAQSTLSPHLRVLQFFESHFSAIRLGNLQDQQLAIRLVSSTAAGLSKSKGHPLAREVHFRFVLFGLTIVRHLTPRNSGAAWKLKDQVLSAALGWFKHPPRWSFGGNRLQIKSEDKILGDVMTLLRGVANIAVNGRGSYKSLQAKQDLVQIFVENERSRLRVWLFPLEPEKKHSSGSKNAEGLASFIRVAWAESPGLAIQLAARFPSAKLQTEVRGLILNFPEKVIGEPTALEIMFDSSLASDVNFQLKVC